MNNPKKQFLPIRANQIPQALKEMRRFLGWRYELRSGNWSKVPCSPHANRIAQWTKASAVADFDTALAALNNHGYDGLQFVLKDTGITAFDLDDCRDPMTGAIKPWAMKIVRSFDSYAEISPSGTGVRIFVKGLWAGSKSVFQMASGKIEVKKHLASVTGHHLPNTPRDVRSRPKALGKLSRELAAATKSPAQDKKSVAPDDYVPPVEDVIAKILPDERYRRLWYGDTAEHPDRSQADDSLLRRIAFFTGQRPELVKRVFLSSGLSQRGKVTGRKDYLDRSIKHALAVQHDRYDWIDDRFPPIKTVRQLCREFPEMRPTVIDGLLRGGETMNLIGSSKMRKTFLAHALAVAVATGGRWLGRKCKRGRVLLLDNELNPQTLSKRWRELAVAKGVALADLNRVKVASMRGRLMDIIRLATGIQEIRPGRFKLIIIDALYRMLPKDCDENSNAQMTAVYNQIDKYADRRRIVRQKGR